MLGGGLPHAAFTDGNALGFIFSSSSLLFLHHFIYVIGGGGGGAAAAGHNDTTGKDVAWSSAMQKARIPTKEELKAYMVVYKTILHDTLPKMYRSRANGGTGKGQ